MRTIRIPEGSLNVADVTPGLVDFLWFVRRIIDTDKRFNESGQGIRAAARVEAALTKIATNEDGERTVFLEEADWVILRDAVESPSGGVYPISPGRVLAPYIEAISVAKS